MHDDAIYVNGVFDSVLREIVAIQTAVPEQILFMQPYLRCADLDASQQASYD